MRSEETVMDELTAWGSKQENVRAMLLTGSRANPIASIDLLSDYDVELVVSDLASFRKSEQWLRDFGGPIANFSEDKPEVASRLVLYEDGIRIDFQIYLATELKRKTAVRAAANDWDIGCRVLFDKDGITAGIRAPTHSRYTIQPPTSEEFNMLMKDFWWDSTYVAKSLWRCELYYAKYMFDGVIRFTYLTRVIEWYIGIKHNWTVNPNKQGRWFKRYLDEEVGTRIESTFAGSEVEDNWNALFATTALFSTMAREICSSLKFEYPLDLENNITAYLVKIRKLNH